MLDNDSEVAAFLSTTMAYAAQLKGQQLLAAHAAAVAHLQALEPQHQAARAEYDRWVDAALASAAGEPLLSAALTHARTHMVAQLAAAKDELAKSLAGAADLLAIRVSLLQAVQDQAVQPAAASPGLLSAVATAVGLRAPLLPPPGSLTVVCHSEPRALDPTDLARFERQFQAVHTHTVPWSGFDSRRTVSFCELHVFNSRRPPAGPPLEVHTMVARRLSSMPPVYDPAAANSVVRGLATQEDGILVRVRPDIAGRTLCLGLYSRVPEEGCPPLVRRPYAADAAILVSGPHRISLPPAGGWPTDDLASASRIEFSGSIVRDDLSCLLVSGHPPQTLVDSGALDRFAERTLFCTPDMRRVMELCQFLSAHPVCAAEMAVILSEHDPDPDNRFLWVVVDKLYELGHPVTFV